MYCKNCGAKNEDNINFCVNCGSKIEPNETKVSGDSENKTEQNTNTKIHKLSKKAKCIILISAIMLVLVAAACKIGSVFMSPEHIITKYINVQAEGNYSKLYEMLDMPDGDFTTKSQFVDTLERSEGETDSVTNINITEASSKEMTTSKLSKYYFTKSFDKAYQVTYILKGDKKEKLVFLSKQKWLLFDKYKVMPTEYLIKGYSINAPSGVTVSFDGIQISDSNSEETTNAKYKLSNVIKGKHNITISAPFADEVDIETDEIYSATQQFNCASKLNIKQSVKEEMQKMAEESAKVICDAVAAKKDFSEISGQLKTESGQDGTAEDKYKSLCSSFEDTSAHYCTNLTFEGIKDDSGYRGGIRDTDAPLYYDVGCNFSYDIESKPGFYYIGNPHEEVTKTLRFNFSYDNNELKINSIGW